MTEYTFYTHTGTLVKNKNTGIVGIVIRETKNDNYTTVQVLEKIQPKVITTYTDGWNQLEVIE